MAVKRKSIAERKKMIGDAIKDINKAAGATIIGTLNDEDIAEKLVIEYIPTPSLRLNEATGGGIPRSKYTLVAGNPDSGKTMLMLETIAHNLETDPDFTGCWIESENSLESTSIKMFGITDKDLKDRFIFMNTDDLTAEEVLDYVIRMAYTGVDMIVINSLKCLTPAKEFQNDMKDDTVALQARVNSKFMRKVIPIIASSGTALVTIQHYSTNIGGGPRAGSLIGGGKQIRYNNVLTLELSKGFMDSKDMLYSVKDQYMMVDLKVTKNHCITDRNTYVKIGYYVKYGSGIDRNPEIIDAVFSSGIVEKKGAWIREFNADGPKEKGNERILPDGTVAKWNGLAAFMSYIEAHPEYFEYLKDKVEGNYGMEDLPEEEVKQLKEIAELETKEIEELEAMLDESIDN